VLVVIDPSDYEIAAERAQAAIARAESQLKLARTALKRQQRLAKRKVGSSADLDTAQNGMQVAEADLRDARASLTQAERDLARTQVRVPFAGRVREKHVDVGQYVNRGTPVARVYAVDYAEVRLPIPDRDAAFVDLPIDYRGDEGDAAGPEVELRARFAGREYTWTGRIVRTEGELDPKTRMIHAVARVEDPYGRSEDPTRPPLAVGLFVDAQITGRAAAGVIALPREAVRGSDEVLVVNADGTVDVREIEVLRRETDRILASSGIDAGDQVVTGPLAVAVDGMHVRVFEDTNEEREGVFASEASDETEAPSDANTAASNELLARAPEASP
jgi:RND family efflux transporter MFP subunit